MASSVSSTKPSYRYSSFKSASKASAPTPSSSSCRNGGGGGFSPPASSKAIVLKNSGEIASRNENKFGSMVRKFMEKKSKPKTAAEIENDLRKAAAATGLKKDSNLSVIHKKLFQRGGKSDAVTPKALTEAKPNARTLAMVLRSERELLDQSRNYESMILELRSKLEVKEREVEKLKDLCLNQREEIRILKDAVLESHLPNFSENRGSDLQNQVKSERSSPQSCDEEVLSPKTPAARPAYNQTSIDSPEFSADEAFPEDMNPCLTPCSSNGNLQGIEEENRSQLF